MEIKEIEKCRICGNPDLMPILDLGIQALSGRFPSEGEIWPAKSAIGISKMQ